MTATWTQEVENAASKMYILGGGEVTLGRKGYVGNLSNYCKCAIAGTSSLKSIDRFNYFEPLQLGNRKRCGKKAVTKLTDLMKI